MSKRSSEKGQKAPWVGWKLFGQRDHKSRQACLVRDLLDKLRVGVDKMISELPEEAYIASLLDPRFKDTFIPENKREMWWGRLDELLAEVALDEPETAQNPNIDPIEQQRDGPSTRSAPQTVTLPRTSYESMIAAKMASKRSADAELAPYRTIAPSDIKVNPLTKWAQLAATYKKHAVLARRFLAIPATSASVERVFSTGGRVIEKRRASLKPKTAKAIVFIHENIHLVESKGIEVADALYDEY
jgi:hypothetical protein